jgi:hypothetical protein
MNASERPRWVADLITIAGVAALFAVLYLLPADTSLAKCAKPEYYASASPPFIRRSSQAKWTRPGSTSSLLRPSRDASR